MQKFNLNQVVQVVKSSVPKEAIIIDIMTHRRYMEACQVAEDGLERYDRHIDNIVELFECDRADLKHEPFYVLCYYKPLRSISFLDFCKRNSLPSNKESEERYKEEVRKVTQVITCERDIEFVANDWGDFLDGLIEESDKEEKETVQKWVEDYDKIEGLKQG